MTAGPSNDPERSTSGGTIMKLSLSWLQRALASSLVLFLAAPLSAATTTPLPSAPQPAANAAQAQTNPPGAAEPVTNAAEAASPSDPAQTTAPAPQTASPQSSSTQTSSSSQQTTHLGTAAAPVLKPGGVPASRPAGAAIAPAKQRRIRSIAIRVGLLVGAAIAIGTVAAASEGSQARPH